MQWVKDIRIKIKERLYNKLYQEYKENIEKGLYPYEGMWLTISQIKAVQEFLKKRDKIVFFEIIFLFFITTVFSLVLYWLLFVIFLPK